MTLRDDQQARASQPNEARARLIRFAAGTAAVGLLVLVYCALTWRSFVANIGVCTHRFCDFVDYYYPMGEAIFRTELPVSGFLYSPFVAILLAVFPPLGLDAALVFWGTLQVLFVILYVFLFRRLVPVGLPIQLLFVFLALSSYPLLINFLGGQVGVFMTVAVLGLLAADERGHRAVAAGLFAFAVSFKFYPIIFLAPPAASRDTRFLLYAAAACVTFLFVIPGVLLGAGDTLGFYGALLGSFYQSDWMVSNPHSQYFPHFVLRLADAMGYDAQAYLPLLRWISFGVAVANMALLILVQRARLRHAALWSFQIVFLTIPFVLKSSWPHDFVFLSFTQTLLAWHLLESRTPVTARPKSSPRARSAVILCFLLLSIVFSNIVFFNLLDNFSSYGFYGFLFWANLCLLIALYVELLPPSLRRLHGKDAEQTSITQ